MSKVDIKDAKGKKAGTAELSDAVFGIEPNISVIHQVVVCQASSMRQGTHATKTRHFVSGGGRKPYRQKGTGRARQGTIRAPHYTGGGVVFGPHPHGHVKRTNTKEVKLALRSVLSGKVRDEELVLVDQLSFEKPSTKAAVDMLKALDLAGKRVTVVVSDDDINTYLSFRNVERVAVIGASEATTRDLIDNAALVMSEAVAKQFEEALA